MCLFHTHTHTHTHTQAHHTHTHTHTHVDCTEIKWLFLPFDRVYLRVSHRKNTGSRGVWVKLREMQGSSLYRESDCILPLAFTGVIFCTHRWNIVFISRKTLNGSELCSCCDVTVRTAGIRPALSVINSVSPSGYLLEHPVDTAVVMCRWLALHYNERYVSASLCLFLIRFGKNYLACFCGRMNCNDGVVSNGWLTWFRRVSWFREDRILLGKLCLICVQH